jgi:hypothetical protein
MLWGGGKVIPGGGGNEIIGWGIILDRGTGRSFGKGI